MSQTIDHTSSGAKPSDIVTPNILAGWLQEMGYRGKIEQDVDGSTYVLSATGGRALYVYCLDSSNKYTTDPDYECTSIRLTGGWSGLRDHDVVNFGATCNRFNAKARFTKAYVRETAYPLSVCLEQEVHIAGGLSFLSFGYIAQIFFDHYDELGAGLRQTPTRDTTLICERHSLAVQAINGPTPNLPEGVRLYSINAREGYAGSLNNLGDLYEKGMEVEQNELVAVYLYTRAAERGEPTAYVSLATLLCAQSDDRSVLMEAAMFAALAKQQLPPGTNKAIATATLETLTQILDDEDMDQSLVMAAGWNPLYQEPLKMKDKPANAELADTENDSFH